jgi:hypothetical protein
VERASARWKTVDVAYEKRWRERQRAAGRVHENMKIVVKVNDNLNANAMESNTLKFFIE